MVHPLGEIVWRFLKILKIELPYDASIPLLSIYTKELNQDLQEISALPCSLLHYPQYSRRANHPNTHDRGVDKGNVAVTEHRVELPVLHSNFPLAIYFTYGNIYVSMPPSQFISFLHYIHKSVSASLFLLWKQVHQYNFSGFHVYALLYNICFPLSDLLHSV